MPKTSAPSKTTAASSKGVTVNKFSRNKERAHLARNSYKAVSKTEKKTSHKCPTCKNRFVFDGAYIIHRKSCGLDNCMSCTQTDLSRLDYAELSEIRGDKYSEMVNYTKPHRPQFHIKKRLSVIVNEETEETKMMWVVVKKYANFDALLEDDGESVIGDNCVNMIDISEMNYEGDDQEIIE